MKEKFSFTGTCGFNAEDSKNPPLRTGKTKPSKKGEESKEYCSLGMSVSAEKNNRAYVELFGAIDKILKNFDNDGNKIEINWDDRTDEDVIKSARSTYIVKIGDERSVFLAPYDVAKFIYKNKDELAGKKITVTGSVNKNIYNGTISDRFQIRNIYVVDEATKNGLTVTSEVYFIKDSVDLNDWKSEKKIIIDGYVEAYIDKDTGNKLVPKQMIFDCSKLDFENEKHIKLLQFKLKQMGLKYEDGKIVNNLKAKKVYKLPFIQSYVNGAEEVEFDESCLTDNQREALELGLKTLDDFKPKSGVYGNRVTIYKIKDFVLDTVGDTNYSDGLVDTELTGSDFEDMLYVAPVAKETAEEVLDAKEEVKESEAESEEDEDDLFA